MCKCAGTVYEEGSGQQSQCPVPGAHDCREEHRNSTRREATTRYTLSDADRMETRERVKNPARVKRTDKAAGARVMRL